jgi:ABC-type lipoprotein export system ATPase subunit
MLELIDVTKRYESPGEAEGFVVLKGVKLQLKQDQILVIVGPSGSGKTTLLNIMGGLDNPTTGRVLLDGKDLASLNENKLAVIRNQEIGFVFQLHHLLPQCTVLENVLVPTLAESSCTSKHEVRQRATKLLERVGLQDHLLYRPGELSGGQRQRVAVVRALINKPRLLLADEPTGSLDEEASQNIAGLLVELHRSESFALVVVTHSLNLAESMGKVMELSHGELRERVAE